MSASPFLGQIYSGVKKRYAAVETSENRQAAATERGRLLNVKVLS